ncbi:MAG: YdcF family protein, partial [bacterium]|nr:YdcF family protein [bacterium]
LVETPEQTAGREKLLAINPDAVFVLIGGTTETGREPRELKSTPYGAKDHVGFFGGGKARVLAAVELHELFPDKKIVTNSTVVANGVQEPHALVYAAELRGKGVPDSQLIIQERSNSTATEIVELLKLAKENGWKKVLALTNDYHIPRAQAFYDNLGKLFTPEYDEETSKEVAGLLDWAKESGVEVVFQDAESVLRLRSSHYATLINESKKTEAYAGRIAAEAKGTNDLTEGRYKLRPLNG